MGSPLEQGTFKPDGDCYALVGGTAGAGVGRLVGSGAEKGNVSMLIWNSDTTNGAFLAFGDDATKAAANANIAPVAGTSKHVVPLPPGSLQTVLLPNNTYYAVYGIAGTPTVYMVPGRGL